MVLGAFLMFTGGILGDRTTGIATIMGIIGIGLLGMFTAVNAAIASQRRRG